MTSSSSSPQVLSIQSSVTFGHVGNSAAVFPMQYRGVNVSSLHTLQYSSHVQYNCGFAGSKTSEQDVRGILSKLHTLSLSQEELAAQQEGSSSSSSPSLFSHILTGYIGSPEIVQAVADYIKQVKSSTLKKKPFFFCDPVCGDNGRMYVLQTVAEGIRDQLVPLADAVAPNFFEASFLSGINIVDDATAMEAAKKIHAMGPRIVVITSYAPPSEEEDSANPTPDPRHKDDPNPRESHKTRLHCLLSRKMMNGDDENTSSIVQDVFAFKNIIGHWVGTGDTFAALILSELAMRGDDMNALPQIVKNSLNVMNSLVEETSRNQRVVGGQRELRIIENRKLFELDSAAKNEKKVVEVAEHVVKSS